MTFCAARMVMCCAAVSRIFKILKRIEDIKKRSSAMVIGINQKEAKNFDGVGI